MVELYTAKHKSIVLEGKHKGFHYKIMDLGRHPVAYVRIPEDNVLYNVSYSNIYISVHGGLTYSNMEPDGYYIGWDYGHHGDYINSPVVFNANPNDKKWTIDEIKRACIDVIEQIIKIRRFRKNEYYYAQKGEEDE